MSANTVREAVGIFHDAAALQAAADTLMISGFDRADLSLLASEVAVERRLGHVFRRADDAQDDPLAPRRAYAGSDSRIEGEGAIVGGLFYVGAVATAGAVVASGGAIAAALLGAAVAGGAGAALGLALTQFIERRHAGRLREQIEGGGLLLWVRVPTKELEDQASDVLRRCGAENVHVHNLPMPEGTPIEGVSRRYTWLYKPLHKVLT